MITSYFAPKPKAKAKTGQGNNETKGEEVPSKRAPLDAVASSNKRTKVGDTNALRSDLPLRPEISEFLMHLEPRPVSPSEESEEDGEGTEDVMTWPVALNSHFAGPSFYQLAKFVMKERASATVYPPPEDTFSALNLTPLDKVKIVVVGQDPYHGPKQAHGLSFSVRKGVSIPPSLRNIYKELIEDPDVSEFTKMPLHGFLERWAKQGVLMLNSVLTVRRGEPNSHKNQGWENATDAMIRAVDRYCADQGVVFLLWGKPAAKKTESLLKSGKHTIICTSHPSPLGAAKTKLPFLGSRCFSRANAALVKRGIDPVDWRVDEE